MPIPTLDATVPPPNAAISLKEYLDGLAGILRKQPETWVRCEVLQIRRDTKYCRIELTDQDTAGKQHAKVSGGCWPTTIQGIDDAFATAGVNLDVGCKVLVKLRADLRATYGFQVEVLDVDPTYTQGDHKARLEAIRARLRDAGHWDRNRTLPKPRDFLRVAVISPPGAAGLGDFQSTAVTMSERGLVRFEYIAAPFQTADAPAKIVEALRSIFRDCKAGRFCAVAIIRGGGASSDLAWLTDHDLTKAVCLMPVPVMTGIGHERDKTLLDEVACIPCDTPSKVAEHVRVTVMTAALEAERALRALRAQAAADLGALDAGVAGADHGVRADVLVAARHSDTALRALSGSLGPDVRRLLDASRTLADRERQAVSSNARARRDEARTLVADAVRTATGEAGALLQRAEATVREAVRAADVAPAAISDAANRGLSAASREIAASASTLLRTADQGVGSSRHVVRAVPHQTATAAAAAVDAIRRQITSTSTATLASFELAVASRAQEVRSVPGAILDAAEAGLRTQEVAIRTHAAAELRVSQNEVARSQSAIAAAAGAAAVPAAANVSSALGAVMLAAQRVLDGCQTTVARIRASAEALDPRAVVAAGYAILRDVGGLPLTGVGAVMSVQVLRAQMRDGSVTLKPVEPTEEGR